MRLRLLLLTTPFLSGLVPALAAQDAPRTVFVVRHAEKGPEATDPGLTPEGVRRAEALARTLEDATISALFASEFKRTQETLAPLHRKLGVEVTAVPARSIDSLVARIQALPPGSNAAVSSHSNLVHLIVRKLSGVGIPELTESDYDRIAVVTVTAAGRGSVVVLRYGEPSAPGVQAPMMKP